MSEVLGAIIYAQLEDEGFLYDRRRFAALSLQKILNSRVKNSLYDISYSGFSAWGFPIVFENTEAAEYFVQAYNSIGERNCYPAWRLACEEPAFNPEVNSKQLSKLMRSGFEQYINLYNQKEDLLPIALGVRPRLVGLRTNLWNEKSLKEESVKLLDTIEMIIQNQSSCH